MCFRSIFRHEKKVLALVLAFACAFTMFAGAAFTDEADINADNADAVDVLTTLGVIKGYEDGSFQPDGTVTRAEMAKMIYVIRNGGNDDASSYESVATSFTDISGHWAEGYIKYLQNTGIVAGKNTAQTIFDPDSTVTTGEAMKMALVLAGYRADKAGLTGTAWLNNTLSYATTYGLTDDVHSAISGGCTRQDAAQILSNALSMDAVVWSEFVSSFVYDGDEGLATGNRQSVGKKWMDLWTNIGTLATINGDNLTIIQDANDVEDSDNTRTAFTNLSVDYTSLLGQKVKVLFSNNKANSVIGVFATGDNTVYTADMKDVEDDGNKVKFGGTSYSFDNNEIDVVVIDANEEAVNYTGTMSAADFDAYDADPTTDAAGTAKLITASVRFVDNDGDGKLNIAIITEYKTAKVTYAGSDRITAGTAYKMEDENIADDIAKNDYAVMSYNPFDECLDIVKADVVSDVLTGLKDQDTYQQYQIGGTWYNIDNDTANNVTRGDTVLAYVVNGIAIDIKSDDGTGAIPSNIAVVVGNGGDASVYGDQVRLRYFNGTNKIVTLSDQNTEDPTQGVAFRVSGSDTSTRLELLNEREYNGYQYVGTDKAVADSNGKVSTIDGVAVADDAVIILYTEAGQSKQITGKQFKALTLADFNIGAEDGYDVDTAATAVFTKSVNGLNRVRLAAVLVGSINITGASSDNYAYVTSASYINADGDTVINIWTGSENKTVTENGNGSVYAKGELIGYSTIDSNNVISDVQPFGTVEDAADLNDTDLTGADGMYRGGNEADDADDMIVINGKQLNVTSDTHVLVVDSAADDEEDIGIVWDKATLPQGKEGPVGTFAINAFFSIDSADDEDTADLKVLVIDTTGVFSAFDEAADDEDEVEVGEGETVDTLGNFTMITPDSGVVEVAPRRDGADNKAKAQLTFNLPDYATAATYDWVMKVGNYVIGSGEGEDSTTTNIVSTETVGADELVTIQISNVTITKTTLNALVIDEDVEMPITGLAVALDAAPADLDTTTGAKITFKVTEDGTNSVNDSKKVKVSYTLTSATENEATTGSVTTGAFDDGTLNNETKTVQTTNNLIATGDGAVTITVTAVELVD